MHLNVGETAELNRVLANPSQWSDQMLGNLQDFPGDRHLQITLLLAKVQAWSILIAVANLLSLVLRRSTNRPEKMDVEELDSKT